MYISHEDLLWIYVGTPQKIGLDRYVGRPNQFLGRRMCDDERGNARTNTSVGARNST
jgi:hypothetical protein